MTDSHPAIVWFRKDLRLTDNPALHAAMSSGRPIVCLYVLEAQSDGERALGGASKWWLDKSLKALSADIGARGGQLVLRSGKAGEVLDAVIEETGAEAVFWNRRYNGPGRERDAAIKSDLKSRGLSVNSYNGMLLTEPWTFETSSGGYYRVFTPYWKTVRAEYSAPSSLGTPDRLDGPDLASEALDDWALHPTGPDWSDGLDEAWTPGEAGAAERLDRFLSGPIDSYGKDSNLPGKTDATSRLSPHLRFGEIGPVQVWRAVKGAIEAGEARETPAMKFLSELAWREFSYVLLYHNTDLGEVNYRDDFDEMPWRSSEADLEAWQKGETGYPIVDAGMRELWHTGWMHNRVRMITASFLTKHLLIPWQEGEAWFWDTLVDADAANNAAGWQWVAGSGADAAPYFRIFNPITQGEKFDGDGAYVRRWCPELSDLPDAHLHAPWQADEKDLEAAGVHLGETYPEPIIEHRDGRQRALDAYDTLKERRGSE